MNWYKKCQVSEFDKSSRDSERGISLIDSGYSYSSVRIYRAVSIGVNIFTMNDYITLSKKFAIGHADSNKWYHEEDQQVITSLVSSSNVVEASNPGEYFYIGPDVLGKVIYISEF